MNNPPQAYYLPAEWAPQSAVMLTWPHNQYWQPVLKEAEITFGHIASAISHREQVIISCLDAPHREHIAALLQICKANLSAITLIIAASNDAWVRDHGPLTLLEKKTQRPLLLDFIFNSWGNKYACELDNQLTQQLRVQQAFSDHPVETIPFVLEGGSIETDGEGSLLTTSTCLLSPTRNPGLTISEVSEKLRTYLSIERILWLHHGHLEGDDTDSHIDTLARFTDAETIAYIQCDDSQDSHYEDLQLMYQELTQFVTTQGKPYQLVPLPWPKAKYSKVDGRRLPASYANFLIINQAVLLPIYQDPSDKKAITQIQRCFPDRTIIPIDCTNLIENFGSLHCVTMQLPAGVIK